MSQPGRHLCKGHTNRFWCQAYHHRRENDVSHHLRWADQAVQVLYSPWSRKKTVPGAGVKRASFAFQVMLGNQTLGGLIADAARKRVINNPCLEYRRSVWVNRSTM